MRSACCCTELRRLDDELLQHVQFFPGRLRGFRFPVRFRDSALENAYVADALSETSGITSMQLCTFIAMIVIRSISLLSEFVHPVQQRHWAVLLWCFLPWVVILLISILLACNAVRITEWRALAIAIGASVAALLSSHQGAILVGAELELNSLYPRADESNVLSDSTELLLVVMVLIAFYGLPLRCSRSFYLMLAVPLFYLASAITLPAGKLERALPDTAWMALRLMLVGFLLFSGQVDSENKLRLEFLRRRRSHGKAGTCTTGRSAEETPRLPASQLVQVEESASSNFSDAVFAEGVASGSIAVQLHALKAVGKDEHWLIPSAQLRLPALAGRALHGDIPVSDIDSGLLGKGGFGAVFKGTFLFAEVAIKLSLPRVSRFEFASLPSELRMLRRLRHPNIVAFYGACVLDDIHKLALVEEFVSGRSLTHKLRDENSSSLEPTHRYNISFGICSALLYLHSQSPAVVHGDLKPDNVLVEDNGLKPKLIDFGFCRLETASGLVPGGTAAWTAPEILKKTVSHPTCAADMFAFGRLLYYVMTGIRPIPMGTKGDNLIALAEAGASRLTWPNMDMKSRYLIICQTCLLPRPEMRASAEQALGMLRKRGTHTQPVLQSQQRTAEGHSDSDPDSESDSESDESQRTSTLEDAYNSDAGSQSSSSKPRSLSKTTSSRTKLRKMSL